MSAITPSIEPRFYSSPQTVSWSPAPDVAEVAISVNDLPPAISEYIAYDTLSPSNPFLAVTQDGNGNVVYDGGFPKFYNKSAPGVGDTTFASLSGSFKFLYNALHFVANPAKTNAGNTNVLVVGDAIEGESYPVKSTITNGFRTSIERICSVAGFTPTIKDRNDWGGRIDFDLAELDQYSAVVLMGTDGGENPDIFTNSAVADIVSYRQTGNGIIMITDHGPDVTDLDDAVNTPGGFFDALNKIAVQFGAYFTGDYDRSPVNVGFLRANYGDHPLYNGMSDSEDIAAGGSESRIVVTDTPTYAPGNIPDTDLTTSGKHVINLLAVMNDGSLETQRFAYTVVDGEFLFFQRFDGDAAGQRSLDTFVGQGQVGIKNIEPDLGTIQGTVWVHGAPVATFSTDQSGTTYVWSIPGQNGFPINGSVMVELDVSTPMRYLTDQLLTSDPVATTTRVNMAKALTDFQVKDAATLTRPSLVRRLRDYQQTHFPARAQSRFSLASALQPVITEQYAMAGKADITYDPLVLPVVTLSSELTAERDAAEPDMTFIVSAEDAGFAIRAMGGDWKTNPTVLGNLLSSPRQITSSLTGTVYWFDGTTLTAIA